MAVVNKMKCENCKGKGKYNYFLAEDHIETRKCLDCKGTGVIKRMMVLNRRTG